MRLILKFIFVFCLIASEVSFAQSPTITVTSANEMSVGLSWQATSMVQISYRRTDVSSNWVSVAPPQLAGAQIDTSTSYGGIRAPGSGTLTLPNPGVYVFRVAECRVYPMADRGGSLKLLCGPNQTHFSGTYNGAVAQTDSVNLPFSSVYEFSPDNPTLPAIGANTIRAVPLDRFGRVRIDWNVSDSYVQIQRYSYDHGLWGFASPTDVFPTFQQNLYPSGSFPAIRPSGSVTQLIPLSGEYKLRIRGCKYTTYSQSSTPSEYCGSYIESQPFKVESLNFNNLPPLVSIYSPSANSQFTTGQSVTVRVSATDPTIAGITNSSSQIAKVEFYLTTNPNQLIGATQISHTATAATSGYYQYSFTPTAAGDYYIVAVASDTGGAKNHAVTSIRAVAPTSTPPQPNNTTPINFSRYGIYYGDFDGDGNRDIYFHGRPLTIILHGDVATPVTLAAPPGFAYFGKPDGSYASALAWDMTDAAVSSCSGCRMARADQDYVLGDMNNDSNPDILVLGSEGSQSSLLISGTEGTALPQVLLEIMSTGQTRRPGQAASSTPYFTSNLRGRSPTISNGQIVVDGVGQTLANLQLVNSTQGASLATNQNIAAPEAPVLPSPTLNAADLAEIDTLSSLGGEFRVTEAGAATYSVPLALPAGTAGVAPEVALSYSSQSGVGNMGLGWSLSAGSSISRCRQTLRVDGQTRPIEFGVNDSFCLDGQRLLVISSDSSGVVYKTEIDNGLIITSSGSDPAHPATFTVTAKDGSTSLYGLDSSKAKQSGFASHTATSPQTNRVMTWHLAEFKDSAENKVVYMYHNEVNQFRLASIAYGYGKGTADVLVNFNYGTRRRADTYWVAGSRFSDNSRLNSISVTDRGESVREYRIAYNSGVYQSGEDLIDRVISVKSCLGEQCSRPLSLDWGFASPGAATKGNGKVSAFSGNIFATSGDFTKNGHPAERISTGDATAPNWVANNVYLSEGANSYWYWSHQESDIDGDGRQDILLLEAYNRPGSEKYYNLYTLLQTNTGFAGRVFLEKLPGNPDVPGGREAPQLQPVDLNADGRMDLVVYIPWSKEWRTYFSELQLNGTWMLVAVNRFLPAAVNDTIVPVDNMRFVDMNADGLPDAVYTKAGRLYVHYLKRSASAPVTSPRAFAYATQANIEADAPSFDIYNFGGVADLNEDGRADILGSNISLQESTNRNYGTSTCNYSVVFRSLMANGSTFTNGISTPVVTDSYTANLTGNQKLIAKCDLVEFRRRIFGPYIADINSDGLMDLVWAFGVPSYLTDINANKDPEYRTNIIRFKMGKFDQTFGPEQSVTINAEATGFELMDTDGDGNLDVVLGVWGNAKRISRWTGTTFSTTTTEVSGSTNARYTDINGDGYLDKSLVSGNSLTVTLGVPTSNNVVTRFQTGVGAVTSVFYEPLRDSGRYIKRTGGDPGSFYRDINDPFANVDPNTNLGVAKNIPVLELISAMPVVTRVASSAPTADDTRALAGVDYSYEGLKIQAGGLGLLGFKKLTTTDMQTGISTTTEYRQDWPFIGTPLKTVTKTRFGNVLKESTSKMGIVGINSANIETKRTAAQAKTSNLGPLVLFTQEARDINYDVPATKLAMPSGPATADPISYSELSEAITTMEMDNQGNVTLMTVTHWSGGATVQRQITTNHYLSGTALSPDAANDDGARFGRLRQVVVRTERPGLTAQTRTADFTYYGYAGAACAGAANLRGLLCSEKITVSDLGGSDPPELTQHFYDAFGNKTTTKTGWRVSPLAEYDSKGRYVQATYDVFHREAGMGVSTSVYPTSLPPGAIPVKTSEVLTRDKFGNALYSRAAIGNGNWVYSVQAATPMGAIYFKGDNAGAFEETRLQRMFQTNANWCPLGTSYITTITKAGGAKATQCFDRVGRDIGGYVIGFAGEVIRTRKDYDVLGRVVRVFEPAKNAAPSIFTATQYDVLGRPVTVTHPFYRTSATGVKSTSQIAMTRFEYGDFTTKTIVSGHTDSGVVDRTKEEVRNSLGELLTVTEMGSRSIYYKYDVVGNLTKTIDPAGNEVVIGYNGLGQKISLNDPDKGTWAYKYNAFGELASQTDAKGTITLNGYDFKGRKTTQLIINTSAGEGNVFIWDYDLGENGLGQVFRESKSDYYTPAREFTRVATFDNLGRPSVTTTTFKGAGTTEESHYQKVVYDKFGRVYQTFDAARAGPQFTYNGVQNQYNEYGYLARVQDAANSGSSPFYTVNAMDARGNVVDMTYGSGDRVTYIYDSRTGFLEEIKRQLGSDQTTVKAYNATWDHLGNLVKRDQDLLGGTLETFKYDNYNRLVSNTLGGTTVTVAYNSIDNITSKSDLESNATYTYHAIKKHAVTKVGNRSFEYDANGNVTKELAGTATRKNLTYTPNDLVKKIEVVGTNAHTSEFFYDSSNTRYKRIDRDATGKVTTTLYLGSVEKIHNSDGTVQWKRQIGSVAQVTHVVTTTSIGAGTRRYFHMDHLGSINAITTSTGAIEQRMAFDPWGARRTVDSNGVSQPSAMTPTSILASYAKTAKPITTRGYTGHEMLDEVGIIHMNGRIYDAYLARFLQADPIIQEPTMVGSLNRYSYTMNNPLNAIDPSGFSWLSKAWKKIKPFVGVIAGVIVGVFCQVCGATIINAALTGAAIGALSAAVNGGNILQGALLGGISAAAFYGVGKYFQNVSAKNLSDPFTTGLRNFGGNSLTSGQIAAQITAHATVGGVLSVVQGGKFGHGFISAGVTKGLTNAQLAADQVGEGLGALVAGLTGGTVSAITGGKFANGFKTAAFQYLFNAKMTEAAQRAHYMKHGTYPRIDGERKAPSLLDKIKRGFLVGKNVDVSLELTQFVRDNPDLANGVTMVVDGATIPFRAARIASDYHAVIESSTAAYNGAYADAGIGFASMIAGSGASHFLSGFVKNDTFLDASSLAASKASETIMNQDCYTCVK